MASFLNQQLTNVGWDALSTALGGGTLTFYKMQAGSGSIIADSEIPPLTQLVSPVTDIAITSYVIEGEGQITLFGNIASETLDAGFNFKELGVFAVIEPPVIGHGGGTPAGARITAVEGAPTTQANPVVPPPSYGTPLMYSYANSYDTADYIPGAGESTDIVNTLQVTIKIDKAANCQISITQGQQFAVTNIGGPEIGAGPWSYTQTNVGYFKRLVKGYATEITEDTNTITIGQKALTQDLDTYVAIGNPDIPPNFSTIQNAHDWLLGYFIPTNIFARINVSAGKWLQGPSETTRISHPNSAQIKIIGAAPIQTTATAITNIDANSFNITLTDASQFLVNDILVLATEYTDTLTNHRWRGGHQILSKAGNVVTVTKNNASGLDYTTGAVGLSCKCFKYPTVIQISGNNAVGITGIGATSLFSVENLTIIGDRANTSRGLHKFISSVKNYVGYNIEMALALKGDDCTIESVCAAFCKWGIVASSAFIRATGNVVTNGCSTAGCWSIGDASLSLGSLVAGDTMQLTSAMNHIGILSQQSSSLTAGRMVVVNNAYGLSAQVNGSQWFGQNGFIVTVTGNRLYDAVAQTRGFIDATLNGGNVSVCSPASGTIGNEQGYIVVRP
jgi:hypothetical protein